MGLHDAGHIGKDIHIPGIEVPAAGQQARNLLTRVIGAPVIGIVAMIGCDDEQILRPDFAEESTQPIVELHQALRVS